MHMKFNEPITEPVTIRVTWLDVEVLRKDFAIGETPEVHYDAPPKTTGVAQIYIVKGGKELPAGCATYWAPDFNGAKALVKEAKRLSDGKKPWQARTKLMAAVKLFEKLAPNSDDLAKAYQELWSICFSAKARPANRARRRQETIAWYEKQLAVYERNGDLASLSGSLVNIGVLYSRAGDDRTALKRALRGLEIARVSDNSKDPEAIAAWTHCVAYQIKLGHPAAAEKLIAEGLARFPNNPSRAYLLNFQAQILETRSGELLARSKALLKKAQELLPPDFCPL